MPASEPTFTDWEQVEADNRRALAVEDFSWSEPPSRRRAAQSAPERSRTRGTTIVLEREPRAVEDRYEDQSRHDGSHHDESRHDESRHDDWFAPVNVEREMDRAWGGRLSERSADRYEEPQYAQPAYDYVEEPLYDAESGRRMVVIRGQGNERRRFVPERPRRAELAFHERASFSPDRTAFWAVLLGVTLLVGCFIH